MDDKRTQDSVPSKPQGAPSKPGFLSRLKAFPAKPIPHPFTILLHPLVQAMLVTLLLYIRFPPAPFLVKPQGVFVLPRLQDKQVVEDIIPFISTYKKLWMHILSEQLFFVLSLTPILHRGYYPQQYISPPAPALRTSDEKTIAKPTITTRQYRTPFLWRRAVWPFVMFWGAMFFHYHSVIVVVAIWAELMGEELPYDGMAVNVRAGALMRVASEISSIGALVGVWLHD